MNAPTAPTRPSRDQRAAIMRDLGAALTHSLELVLAMGIGLGLGWKAQDWWPAITPWGMVAGGGLGAGAVFRSMWRMVSETDRRARGPEGSDDA